jgi:hypothetical protein
MQVPLEAADQEEIPREDLAPVIMRGHWRLDQRQRSLFARLRCSQCCMRPSRPCMHHRSCRCAPVVQHADVLMRRTFCICSANKRVMLVVVGVALLAAANAILVPISMEAAVQVSHILLVISFYALALQP